MLAEPLQDEFVMQQAVKRSQEEDVEGQVANSLLLKLPTQSLHLPTGPEEERQRRHANVKTAPTTGKHSTTVTSGSLATTYTKFLPQTFATSFFIAGIMHLPTGPFQFHQAL